MFTDGELEELHRFANKIGMKREWFQDRKNSPHYDLTPKRRKLAVEHGAIEITTKQWLKKERAKLIMDEIAFEALTASTHYTDPPMGNLSMKDIIDVYEKMKECGPINPYPNLKDGVVHPSNVEILLPLSTDIKRDEKGKVISFRCFGKDHKVTQYIPEGTIYLFDLESVGIIKNIKND